MIYFILGEDEGKKQERILELKAKTLTTPDASQFDYEVLHANKLDSASLKKSLLALPAIVKQRLIVIHESDKLTPQNQEIILEFGTAKEEHAVVILESREWTSETSLVNKLKAHAKVIDYSETKANVFDMTKAMTQNRPAEALQILTGLMEEGTHPLQIMGGLVWFWGKNKPQVGRERFEKGLRALQEADLNIKRSRLKPEYAVEVLVTKLCGLMRS